MGALTIRALPFRIHTRIFGNSQISNREIDSASLGII